MKLLVCGGIYREVIAGRRRLGGSGLTAALTAAAYGADVSLAGWVGESEADNALCLLDAAGVDRLGVLVLPGETTSFQIADAADIAPPHPVLHQGAVPNGRLPALPDAGVVLAFGTPGFDAVRAGWLDRPAEGATLVFDRQGTHSLIDGAAMAASIPAVRRILLANAHEAMGQTHQETFTGACRRLPPDGFQAAVCKCGPWGVVRIDEQRERHFGAHPVTERNTVGSGDVFAGVLGAALTGQSDLDEAIPQAAAAAAAWISSSPDQDLAELPARALSIITGASTWVDRRRLERARYPLLLDLALNAGERDRVARALRYLGIESAPAPGVPVHRLDLRPAGAIARADVASAIALAVAWARTERGETISGELLLRGSG